MTLKAGHNNVPDYPHGQIIQHFADLVSKKTNGEVKVDVFANATLGDEEELIEGMRAGSVDMGKSITSIVALTVPQFAVFDLPYLFRRDDVGNTRHAARLTDGWRSAREPPAPLPAWISPGIHHPPRPSNTSTSGGLNDQLIRYVRRSEPFGAS